MGFVDEWPSKMQGQWFFRSRVGWAKVFGRVQKMLIFFWGGGGYPCLYLPPSKGLKEEVHSWYNLEEEVRRWAWI